MLSSCEYTFSAAGLPVSKTAPAGLAGVWHGESEAVDVGAVFACLAALLASVAAAMEVGPGTTQPWDGTRTTLATLLARGCRQERGLADGLDQQMSKAAEDACGIATGFGCEQIAALLLLLLPPAASTATAAPICSDPPRDTPGCGP